jgi:hypothetical protein
MALCSFLSVVTATTRRGRRLCLTELFRHVVHGRRPASSGFAQIPQRDPGGDRKESQQRDRGSAERECADDCAGDTDRDKQCRLPSPVTGHRPCVETVGKARVFVAQTSLDFPESEAIVMTGHDHSLTSLDRFVGRRRRHPIGRVLRTVGETVLRTAAWPSTTRGTRAATESRETPDRLIPQRCSGSSDFVLQRERCPSSRIGGPPAGPTSARRSRRRARRPTR